LNWGRTLSSIHERDFGDFELYMTNYNIRVPNLYIWGRKSSPWERDVGEKDTL